MAEWLGRGGMGNSTLHGEPPMHTTLGAVLDRMLAQVCYRKWIAVDRGARDDWPMETLPPSPSKFISLIAGLRAPRTRPSGRVSIDRVRPALFFNRRAGTWDCPGHWATGQTASEKRDSASHLHLI